MPDGSDAAYDSRKVLAWSERFMGPEETLKVYIAESQKGYHEHWTQEAIRYACQHGLQDNVQGIADTYFGRIGWGSDSHSLRQALATARVLGDNRREQRFREVINRKAS